MGNCMKCINLDINEKGNLICKVNGKRVLEIEECDQNYEESEYAESEE